MRRALYGLAGLSPPNEAADAEAAAAAAMRMVAGLGTKDFVSGGVGSTAAESAQAAQRVALATRAEAAAAAAAAEEAELERQLAEATLASLGGSGAPAAPPTTASLPTTVDYPRTAAASTGELLRVLRECSHGPDVSFRCAYGLFSPAEVELATDSFNQYDVDGDGAVSLADFGAAMAPHSAAWAEPAMSGRLQAMFVAADIDGDGCVRIDEFIVMRAKKRAAEAAAETVAKEDEGEGEEDEALRAAISASLSEVDASRAATEEEESLRAAISASLSEVGASRRRDEAREVEAIREEAVLAAALEEWLRQPHQPSHPPEQRVLPRGLPHDPFPSADVAASPGRTSRTPRRGPAALVGAAAGGAADAASDVIQRQQAFLHAAETRSDAQDVSEWP